MKRFISTIGIALAFAACSSTPETSDQGHNLQGVDYPEWVTRGSGAVDGDKKIIYGVGMVNGVKNPPLARTTAGNRARSEISKVFEVYSASLMKDYSASTTAGAMDASSEEQLVSNAIKTFSANTLNGVEIVEHWVNPNDGTIYALARLDMDGFMDQLSGAKELSDKVKERVKRAAEKAFSDLEAEEAKRAEQ